MKKTIFEFAFLIVILLISCIGIKLLLELKEDIAPNKEIESIKSEQLNLDLFISQNIYETISNNDLHLNNNDIVSYFKKIGNNTNNPILLYRYSAFSCDICVKFGDNKLKDYFTDYKNNLDLLFIVSDFPVDEHFAYSNLINLGKTNLDLPIEQANLPFYFMLIDNKVQHVFVPDKSFPEYTDGYLKEIKRRYFNH